VACHDGEVPRDMTEALAAQLDYKRVDQEAIALRTRARARLGRTVLLERKRLHKTQQDAADELGVVVEQVRRYEAEWRRWQETHPDELP
jgi:hypothetical protein